MSLKAIAPSALTALLVVAAIMIGPTTYHSQAVQLIKVDGSRLSQEVIGPTNWQESPFGARRMTLGKIDDIVIGPDNRALFAVLRIGGTLGFGGRLVAVPFERLAIGFDGKIVLPRPSRGEQVNYGA